MNQIGSGARERDPGRRRSARAVATLGLSLLALAPLSGCLAGRGHTYKQGGLSLKGGAIVKTGRREYSVRALRVRSDGPPITRFRYLAGVDRNGDRALTDPPDRIDTVIDNPNASPSVTVAEVIVNGAVGDGSVLVHAEVYYGSGRGPVWSSTWGSDT